MYQGKGLLYETNTSTQELHSLTAAHQQSKRPCPVEIQQQLPSAKERNILIQEMDAEFLCRKKVTICGLPSGSTNEVCYAALARPN